MHGEGGSGRRGWQDRWSLQIILKSLISYQDREELSGSSELEWHRNQICVSGTSAWLQMVRSRAGTGPCGRTPPPTLPTRCLTHLTLLPALVWKRVKLEAGTRGRGCGSGPGLSQSSHSEDGKQVTFGRAMKKVTYTGMWRVSEGESPRSHPPFCLGPMDGLPSAGTGTPGRFADLGRTMVNSVEQQPWRGYR